MNDKKILKAIHSTLDDYSCWEEPKKISDELQRAAFDALSDVLALLESAEPNDKTSFHSYFFDYIPQLYQLEQEIMKGCYYNACYELYCLSNRVPLFERQILPNVIDVLNKNLSGGTINALEKEKNTI